MRETDADFAAWVRARQLRLLCATSLVSGDSPRAERLVLGALMSLALHWDHVRGGTPDAYVRTRVQRAALAAAEGDLHSGGVAHAVPVRLRRLTPRQRAVLVLRWYEGRSVDDTSEVLGLSSDKVRQAEAQARTALAPSGSAPLTGDEVTAALETASAAVREVDLADRAWHDALLHRATTRRRAVTAVAAAALVVGGAATRRPGAAGHRHPGALAREPHAGAAAGGGRLAHHGRRPEVRRRPDRRHRGGPAATRPGPAGRHRPSPGARTGERSPSRGARGLR